MKAIQLLALANMRDVERIEEYVRARLRGEIADGPRGTMIQLARTLGISGAHISNITATVPTRNPGEDVRRACAKMWGMTMGELEAAALGKSKGSGVVRTIELDPTDPANAFKVASDFYRGIQVERDDTPETRAHVNAVIEAVRGKRYMGAGSPTVKFWTQELDEMDRALLRAANPGRRKRVGVRDVTEDDDL
jgi:hypothetical protein